MTREELNKELEKKLEEVKGAEGFFVTVTVLKGDKLEHYQCQSNFRKEDIGITLQKLAEMVGEKLVRQTDILAGIMRQRTWN